MLDENTTNIPIMPKPGAASQVITAAGSDVCALPPCASATLVVNVAGAVSGTNPTLTFTLAEVDPLNRTTVTGASASGAAILATGVQQVVLGPIRSGMVKVSWAVGGTASPTFSGVNVSLCPNAASVDDSASGEAVTVAQLPASLGSKADAGSLSVTDPSRSHVALPAWTDHVALLAVPGTLYGSPGCLTSTSADGGALAGGVYFLQLHNKVGAVNGDVPVWSGPFTHVLGVAEELSLERYVGTGKAMSLGAELWLSTTDGTLTKLVGALGATSIRALGGQS